MTGYWVSYQSTGFAWVSRWFARREDAVAFVNSLPEGTRHTIQEAK